MDNAVGGEGMPESEPWLVLAMSSALYQRLKMETRARALAQQLQVMSLPSWRLT